METRVGPKTTIVITINNDYIHSMFRCALSRSHACNVVSLQECGKLQAELNLVLTFFLLLNLSPFRSALSLSTFVRLILGKNLVLLLQLIVRTTVIAILRFFLILLTINFSKNSFESNTDENRLRFFATTTNTKTVKGQQCIGYIGDWQ